ncbi:heterokaryon incompatibility protein-domain-containing protein [Apodospora peruviana]|uniref:Heterokaryon incompatibility protein-domain-containing protein n=1 Tax=Apodospora peruviana TaxID=516989 RepID=A0AAE0HZL2_9PEZI|nr:heterokaryon incompatibility protein-domain-containing protein [Apodospora peruviana]
MSTRLSIPQSLRRLLLILLAAIILLAVATGFFGESFRPKLPKVPIVFSNRPSSGGPFYQECRPENETNALDTLPDIIRALWAPLVVPITSPTFRTFDGTDKRLPPPNKLIHTQPLGKRICILDVDTRHLSDDGNVFSSRLPTWDTLKPASAGFLSHYLYAQIHGYTYKFVRPPPYPDRAPHWTKVIFTQHLLRQYDIVITLDYDTLFPSPEVPIEWLLNYWQIDRSTLVAMAEDPNVSINRDLRGHLNLNTGFIIAQSSEQTDRLFGDWANCPSEKRYKGCAKWKDKIFHEQAAFSSHVRYDFLDGYSVDSHPGYIRTLPCNEANGIPETRKLGCTGQLVRHYWGDKVLGKKGFGEGVLRALTPLLTKGAFGDGYVVEDFRGKVLDGDRIVDLDEELEGLGTRKGARRERLHFDIKYIWVKYIWVDAICINQLDFGERARQVFLMQHIYKKAIVGVHLDVGDDETDYLAFSTLKEIGEKESKGLRLAVSDDAWSSLHVFFCKPWFKRMWVIQEFVLAEPRPAMILAAWSIFRMESDCLTHAQKIAMRDGIREYLTLSEIKLELEKRRPPQLLSSLLWSFRDRHATDPRDKVYSLMGVLSESSADCNSSIDAQIFPWMDH